MKTQKTMLLFATLFTVLFTSCKGDAQNKEVTIQSSSAAIELIQFHSENRCMTCNKIEDLSKETIASYPEISFRLVNVDDKANEDFAKKFDAFGTALFLYHAETDAKMNLTEFAFMNAGNKDRFIEGLKKNIVTFKN